MTKFFNTNGYCEPELHYMVDLTSRLEQMKNMVEKGNYFTIRKARQYGKTTLLIAFAEYLKKDYDVISLDFQGISHADFASEQNFVAAFSRQFLLYTDHIPDAVKTELTYYAASPNKKATLSELFSSLLTLCKLSSKKIILMIDEVDSASNNQVFLDFLAQLRFCYLKRRKTPAFQSVILASVYDIRTIKQKLRPEEEHRQNSPWNISADFDIEMSFSQADIVGMLKQYEQDHHTEMDIQAISSMLYEYTSGYPFLVSRLCQLIDERLPTIGWTKEGIQKSVKQLLSEKNALFESLIGKLNDYPVLKEMIYQLLFQGQPITYNADDPATDMLLMFGFAKIELETVQIANRIFETRLYHYFLTLPEVQTGELYRLALRDKNQFFQKGQLDMKHLLEKFIAHFHDV